MDEKRPSRLAPALIAAAVLLPVLLLVLLLVTYVGGYFWLSVRRDVHVEVRPSGSRIIGDNPWPGTSPGISRYYTSHFEREIFWPAAIVESSLRGVVVTTHFSKRPLPP